MSEEFENDFSFHEMMGDVKPLHQDTAVHKKSHTTDDNHLLRQLAAVSIEEELPEYLTLDNAPMLKPDDIIEFKRSGVQNGVYRKLRLGKYPIQAKLDLHRRTLTQARDEVVHFLKQCLRLEARTIIIVHGKGHNSNPPALMKSYVAFWLQQINEVLCVHSAQAFHGGSGAIYVMLKKNEEKKLENRERHQKRQG
ncbi:DNA mismatch repair protein MutS [Vibrio breoganii]|uniref:DNA endonuclease SmrA n=1 Tax=Vibrio breoganii TaxID=553239 RepID=UPI00080E3395|nr:DNA endonuclease SmrA [Vibrio breoganii]MDN3717825.1 DNA endonuclease SmrA [Vibrio breoganii]OCH74187.1 DNA mismatch repair protein MutS [Vibrio breoganii]PMF99903.1 DNA mismatch repair protein MutS [Vibrio breoganii]PMG76447.1 DNA mismatch repair protein MutS [Vibrio breoganii]PMH19803.1 DNA mismatch repair protein MutS [Vibrio breoganii]